MSSPRPSEGGSLVRSFMATKGRTESTSKELAIETVVEITPEARTKVSSAQFEQRKILELLDSPASIAEVAAKLKLPIRTAIILVSELASEGLVDSSDLVDTIDTDFLMTIRNAIEAL